MRLFYSTVMLLFLFIIPTHADTTVLAVDRVGVNSAVSPASDLLSVSLIDNQLRISFLSLSSNTPSFITDGKRVNHPERIPLSIKIDGSLINLNLVKSGNLYQPDSRATTNSSDKDAIYIQLDRAIPDGTVFEITTVPGETILATYPPQQRSVANCALVLHGNQGLGYSDVFYGESDNLEGSGFDEAMQVHQATGVPGNFHLSGTLQSSAEWAANSGDPMDFNGWLATGVTEGWAGMITSAYAQHIMPFVLDNMNNWAISTESNMIIDRYGYTPTVAWVPERVWLNSSGYPSGGVSDWIGDNFVNNGVGAVILDDDVHCSGHDNHQIHTMSGSSLRIIPRDRDFTGNLIGGNGQAALDLMTYLAGSGVGPYRIAVMAEDWEAVSEMGHWGDIVPFAQDTYDWFIGKCYDESAWLSTWKLSDAVANPDFNGDLFSPNPGTYGEIGGGDGYGGSDNAWYTRWAGWIPSANGGDGNGSAGSWGGNNKNYGTLWNDSYNSLMSAPSNNISEAGWYTLMTNLHETGWHDGLGGDISGWQHNYSSHMKNATVFAEAAKWSDGQYPAGPVAQFQDIDNDGFDEVVIYNDNLFAVVESIGGRITHLFVNDNGFADVAIGCDNTYWSGTTGDYNDDNHKAAFSEVSPNYQHNSFNLEINGTSVTATHNEVSKTYTLIDGEQQLETVYHVGQSTHWIQSGFSPSLVDLVWNAQMDRVWSPTASYMGQHNPNTGLTTALVLGSAGSEHQMSFSGTLMKGDEIKGDGTFAVRLFAGLTSAPLPSGELAELQTIADGFVDNIGPAPLAATFYPTNGRLKIEFDQLTDPLSANPVSISVGGISLTAETVVIEVDPSYVLTFELDSVTADAIDLLGSGMLAMAAGTVTDELGNGNIAVSDVVVEWSAMTLVTIDGNIEPAEWTMHSLEDLADSEWSASNEIDNLHVSWDDTYLYFAVDGVVNNNSWLVYIDVDPGSLNGQADLTAIDSWERGASFSAVGFLPDFQYGCYQHQSTWDGDGMWQLLSPTTTLDVSSSIISAFDSQHLNGAGSGSEVAVPWETLYDLGPGAVPANAQISIVASICWDPEPDGSLGGDSAPSNIASVLPIVDNCWTITVDANGDGLPDNGDLSAVPAISGLKVFAPFPNPFNPSTTISFDIPTDGRTEVIIFNPRGEKVAILFNDNLIAGRHNVVWHGIDSKGKPVSAGTYFCSVSHSGQSVNRLLTMVK
ncbi:hypothetical protein HOD41_02660 [bacterium]|nr:hypothetical protein [bacterium]